MKKNILLTLLTICFLINVNEALAQCNPRPYTSPSDPLAWDWRGDSDYSFVTGVTNGQPIITLSKSPWYVNETSNLNTNPFKLQFPKDYETADGWVLVQRDFGKISPQAMAVDYPYFILYNKFSGILRVFVAITQKISGYSAAVITLTYVNGQGQTGQLVRTAILENHTANSFRSALDDFDNQVPVIAVPNYYSNTTVNPYWLHADFSMNYDPCTCNNLSQLIFEAKLISSANLSFQLNGSIVSGADGNGNGGAFKQALDYSKSLGQVIDAGISGYKSAEEGIGFIKSKFPNLLPKTDIASFEKFIPGLAGAVGVLDFLSGVFGGGSSTAMSYDVNLQATGNITTTDPYKSVLFENPGSSNLSLVPQTLLNYNNIMGVFNLLETPEIATSGPILLNTFPSSPQFGYGYYVNKPISYIINPNSGYRPELSDIRAALMIEVVELSPSSFMPSYNFPSTNTIIEEERRGQIRSFRTKYVSISNIGDLMIQLNSEYNRYGFRFDQIVPSIIYLKIVATLNDGNGHQGVFISKIKTKPVAFSFALIPTSLQNIPEDITLSNAIVTNTGAWNTVTINQGTSFNTPGISISAGNSVVLGVGASLTNQAVMKVGMPNGKPTVISQGDPSSICASATYITKSTQFARQGIETEQLEKENRIDKRITTAFPNPTNDKVTFRYYLEEPTQVKLNLIDLTGKVVATPVDAYQELGSYDVAYDAINLPAGVYIYTLETNKGKETKRLVVIK